MEEFKNMLSSNQFYPLINKPTRITKSSATLIDNIYCNMPNISNKYYGSWTITCKYFRSQEYILYR